MANYTVTDTELTDIADAIIAKAGLSGQLEFPTDFVSGISGISTGTDVSDTTATASDVRTGKYFYTANGTKTQGTIQDQAAQAIHPSTTDQTIASGKYLTGTQTVKGVLLTNLDAGNIKKDVVVKIGDSTDDDCVTSVTGTYEGGGGGGDDKANEIIERTISGTYENSIVTKIGSYAFYSCDQLESISFPNCTSIGSSAFASCVKLNKISFAECTYIASYAFQGCGSLTAINFPKCKDILNYGFSGCSKLSAVSLNADGVYFGAQVFTKCRLLISLYLLGSIVATLGNINTFSSTPIAGYTASTGGVYGSIYVPASLYNTYKTSTNWVTFSDRFVSV